LVLGWLKFRPHTQAEGCGLILVILKLNHSLNDYSNSLLVQEVQVERDISNIRFGSGSKGAKLSLVVMRQEEY
jgi:hypothetical protein